MATGLFNLKQVNQAISQGAWSGYIAPKWVEYLVVAGGGGGGSRAGGGGGAGGLLTGVVSVAAGTSYTVTVGTGGAGGVDTSSAPTSGNNSVLGSISSAGGGYGSSGRSPGNSGGASGGSGGGGSYSATSYGQGTSGQGNAGSAGLVSTSGNYWIGGSGGGAGTIALNGVNNGTSSVAGYGGAGIASSISGSVVVYAGGGGGGSELSAVGTGGVGGGGSGGYAANGTAGGGNTGGGGGGGGITTYSGGNGGSGIVVVRYPGNVQFFTGGTVNYNNGYIIHIFTSSGTLAPTTPTVYNTSYQISRSLRFNSADSTYLDRTPASSGNRRTWTWSGWVKKTVVGDGRYPLLFGAQNTTRDFLRFNGEALQFVLNNGTSGNLATTAVYRDVSAWYHIVLAVDTTQATDTNRVKIYVNGVQVTAFSTTTYPAQNYDTFVNMNVAQRLGNDAGFSDGYYNGYMTEIYMVDGQQLTPSSFGATSTTTGVWAPIQYTGTYGTNGFYLNFSDNSNTTAATLGKDYSGNGNNWTPNNFSVTAGAGNDSLVDSPTAYGFDTGVGGTVRGNYATLNPLDKNPSATASSNGNLDVVLNTGSVPDSTNIVATMAFSSGKWYWECVWTADGAPIFGVWDTAYTSPDRNRGTSYLYSYLVSGSKYNNGTATAYGASWTIGDVIGVALDMDAGTLTFYKNGSSQGTAFSSLTGKTLVPAIFVSTGSTNAVITANANFGQRPFAYTAPSGYKALCTQNLPTPTIGATSTTLATKYFNPVLYTGNGSARSITGVGFQPDFTWIKARSIAYSHRLADSVRGAGKELYSDDTAAETTNSANGYVTSFNSDGFSLGTGIGVNANTQTFVAWNWRAGNNAGSSNTSGSITSTVSANTTSGFSVVTWTEPTSGSVTVGHGLGVAPSLLILKNRTIAGTNWNVWHSALTASQYLNLNTTGAVSTSVNRWNNTLPTSTVFSAGSDFSDPSSPTMVAYCFAPVAGFSAFGSYTGNNSTDGTFVFTGFRVGWVMIKCTSGGTSWIIYDATRNTYNATTNDLIASSSSAEATSYSIDLLSNGFKIRSLTSNLNDSGLTYIYAAFASNPFKTSLAR